MSDDKGKPSKGKPAPPLTKTNPGVVIKEGGKGGNKIVKL